MSNSAEKMPTFKEELTAKALEIYENLMSKRERSIITNCGLELGLTVLNDAVGWAIDKQASSIITADKPKVDHSFQKKWVFINTKGELLVMVMDADMWGVEVKTHFDVSSGKWGNTMRFDFSEESNPIVASIDKCKRIFLKLRKMKYIEVKT